MSSVSNIFAGTNANNSSNAPTTAGVERCAEGGILQATTADTGTCEQCNRWVFPKEKVMSCRCCSSYYCSTCAPQVRDSTDNKEWEYMLSSVGRALRDADTRRLKISSEIDVNMQRFRSAFNCQNAGNETLSADQIFVEHAMEQAKTVFADCAAPDTSELRSQEEIFDHRVEYRNTADFTAQPQEEAIRGPEEPTLELPKDLLDLSEAPSSYSPEKAAAMDLLDFEVSAAAVPDLLDLGGDESQAQPGHHLQMKSQSQPAALPTEHQADLLDIADPIQETAPSPAAQEPEDLLDFSESAAVPNVPTEDGLGGM